MNAALEGRGSTSRWMGNWRISLTWVAAALCLLSATCEISLSGRLSISNVVQPASMLALLAAARWRVSLTGFVLCITGLAQVILVEIWMAREAAVEPNALQIVYFLTSALLLLAAVEIARDAVRCDNFVRHFESAARWSPAIYFTAALIIDPPPITFPLAYFEFNDKSHACVCLCMLALLAIEKRSGRSILLSAWYLGLATLTASRLWAIFFFFYALILGRRAVRWSLRGSRVRLPFVFGAAALVLIALVAVTISQGENSILLDRLSPTNHSSAKSNNAHALLAGLAIDSKLYNVPTLLLGTGPGQFSRVLALDNPSLSELGSLDPDATDAVVEGSVPVHSVPVSVFVEFPLTVFASYVLFSVLLLRQLTCSFELFCIGGAFMLSSVFYSLHNHVYYFVFLAYLIMKAASVRRRQQRDRSQPASYSTSEVNRG